MEQRNDTQYAIDTVEGFASRTVSRLFKVIVALIVAWALTIAGFVWYLNQFDFISQDGEGINVVGIEGSGAYIYGPAGESQENE